MSARRAQPPRVWWSCSHNLPPSHFFCPLLFLLSSRGDRRVHGAEGGHLPPGRAPPRVDGGQAREGGGEGGRGEGRAAIARGVVGGAQPDPARRCSRPHTPPHPPFSRCKQQGPGHHHPRRRAPPPQAAVRAGRRRARHQGKHPQGCCCCFRCCCCCRSRVRPAPCLRLRPLAPPRPPPPHTRLCPPSHPPPPPHPPSQDLLEVVAHVKPHALIGLSGAGPSWPEPVIRELCRHVGERSVGWLGEGRWWVHVLPMPDAAPPASAPKPCTPPLAPTHTQDAPLVFPLSNPTTKSEISAQQAYSWSGGKCLFAAGSPFAPVELEGQRYVPGQARARELGGGGGGACRVGGGGAKEHVHPAGVPPHPPPPPPWARPTTCFRFRESALAL